MRAESERVPAKKALESMVKRYLSASHLTQPEQGCLVAALGTEAIRSSPEVRQELAQRSHDLAGTILPFLPDGGALSKEDLAMAALGEVFQQPVK